MLAIQKAEEEERDAGAVRRRRSPAEQQDFLERLVVVQVARAFGVATGELQAGSRRQAVVAARAALVWPGKGHGGLPTLAVARVAGVSTVSARRLMDRGKAVLVERGLDPDDLPSRAIARYGGRRPDS